MCINRNKRNQNTQNVVSISLKYLLLMRQGAEMFDEIVDKDAHLGGEVSFVGIDGEDIGGLFLIIGEEGDEAARRDVRLHQVRGKLRNAEPGEGRVIDGIGAVGVEIARGGEGPGLIAALEMPVIPMGYR